VGPRAGLEAVAKKKIPAPAGNQTLAVQSVAQSLHSLSYPKFRKVKNLPTAVVSVAANYYYYYCC
jgi:hypothetical protein